MIGEDIDLDTGPCGTEASNRGFAPRVGGCCVAVDKIGGIVAGTVVATITKEIRVTEVSADLLGGAPEVIERLRLVGNNVTCGDENVVGADSLTGVGEVERVVQCSGCFVVGEAVEVPVCL